MNNYTKQLQDELNNSPVMSLFEIEVTDGDGDQDWILCNISFRGNSIIAERVGVSTRQEKSDKIAFDKVTVDNCFSLDEHLQALHEKVTDSIQHGNLFELV